MQLRWWDLAKQASAQGDKRKTLEYARAVHQLCPSFFFADNIWKHPFGYYAQDEQDFAIEAIFEQIPPRSKFFVEVGGFDPYFLSNTRRLINQGWSGISIEPSPKPAERLRAAAPPNVQVLECACAGETGRTTLWETDWPGMEPGGAIASMRREQITTGLWAVPVADASILRHSAGTQQIFLPEPRPVEVAARTLNDILAEVDPPSIDLLLVDVETAETMVFDGFDLEKYLPAVIVIETGRYSTVVDRIVKADYPHVFKGSGDFYFARG